MPSRSVRLLGVLALTTSLLGPAASARSAHAQDVVAQDAVVQPAPFAVPEALEDVAALLRRNQPEEALRALRALPTAAREHVATRYLEGRLAERLGELTEALVAYGAVSEPLPERLVTDASTRRARLLARTGQCDAVEAQLAARPRLPATLRALRAECALARGALPDAERWLADAADEDARDVDSFALRTMLAEAQLRQGARDRAIATLHALLVARPEHPDAERIWALLTELRGRAPTFTLQERLARAERFASALAHERAAAELEGQSAPRDRALQRRLLHTRGMALFKSRGAYAEAARVLTQAAALPGPTRDADAFHAARALSRAGDDAGAVRAYRQLVTRSPRSREGAEAEYLAAWLEVRMGRRGGAQAMQRFLRGPRAELVPDLAREARWQIALDAFTRREYARAAELFSASAQGSTDPLVRGRGTYWRARALAAAGDRRGAIATYRQALHQSPLHWYALLSRQRLIELGQEPPPPFALEARTAAPPPTELTLPDDVATLLALGLDRDARAAARAQERQIRGGADLRAIARVFERLGDHERTYRLTTRNDALDRPALGAETWAWNAAYPRAFESAVTRAAAEQELSPELLWAIMRQESAYDPEAVSYADAIGLLQLLPSTAANVARGMGIRFEREMLFDPEWNTRLAAAYVRTLVREHGVPLAFAAFNAGGHRVTEWRQRSGAIDLDLFVEQIPFDQTRGYIRRVTSHLARYLYLRAPESGWPELELPMQLPAPSTERGRTRRGTR